VALNKDSKRKTQSVVTIRHDERIYGSDAVSLVTYRLSNSSNVICLAHLFSFVLAINNRLVASLI
jgi:hypothetical protein